MPLAIKEARIRSAAIFTKTDLLVAANAAGIFGINFKVNIAQAKPVKAVIYQQF